MERLRVLDLRLLWCRVRSTSRLPCVLSRVGYALREETHHSEHLLLERCVVYDRRGSRSWVAIIRARRWRLLIHCGYRYMGVTDS